MFVFSVGRLLSRRCHSISSIPRLHSCPSQNRTSGFPIHPAPRGVLQRASALRHGFRSMRMRGVGQPTWAKAWTKPGHVYAGRWLLRLSHLNRMRSVRRIAASPADKDRRQHHHSDNCAAWSSSSRSRSPRVRARVLRRIDDPSSRQESPGAAGRCLSSPSAACFRGGATISRPYPGCTPAPPRTGQADFPYIRLLGVSFSEPPLYDTGSGRCGCAAWASGPGPRPGQSRATCMPAAGSCG